MTENVMSAVDGEYSDWSFWGPCNVTCSKGTMARNRTCTGPLYGGFDCQGAGVEYQECNTDPCPGEFPFIVGYRIVCMI